ncbi:ESX secretion-associated protein EspG [Tomitella fengzijianii]|uniref:ESX secretion-associated protein EspG n=1 Tax=Tomitella fengzijianii TaxID=2597660 RepID=UPI00131C4FB4|nr:ESX secretion-associated protein EspG [Tomitella fengzijianii]
MSDRAHRITLSIPELQRCAGLLGIEELPLALGGGPERVVGAAPPSTAEVDGALRRRGLLTTGGGGAGPEPCPPLAELVSALCSAPEEVAARRITEGGVARLCLAGDRPPASPRDAIGAVGLRAGVAATRATGDDAPVALSWSRPRRAELMRFLGDAEPVALRDPVRVPLAELQQRLAECGEQRLTAAAPEDPGAVSQGECAAAFIACGAPADAADTIAVVLCSVTAWSEVVRLRRGSACAPGPHEAVPPAAMVVYDSPRGRLVAAPGRAPGGVLWATFGPGDAERIGRGLEALADLAE